MKKLSKNQRKLAVQIIQYLISGGAYFWSGYALFAYLWSVAHWSLWWTTIVSNVFGWLVNYLLQRYWVFNNRSLSTHKTQVTFRYGVITLTDFLLNYLILYGLKQVGITPYIGQFISAGFFTVWNYLWYRYWVFPEKFHRNKKHHLTVFRAAHRPHGHSAYRV